MPANKLNKTGESFPFNMKSNNRFSYMKQKDPNFSQTLGNEEQREIKVEGQLPYQVIKKIPRYSYSKVLEKMGRVSSSALQMESERMA